MDANNLPEKTGQSFIRSNGFRSNQGLLYMALILAVPAYILSLLIGLNPIFTTGLLVLFLGVAFVVRRWRSSRSAKSTNAPGNVSITGVIAAVAVFVLIQAVPYGRSHSNGAVVKEPAWATSETRSLMVRACYDCHSNQVKYPAYSNIAPLSWLIAEHVSDGRSAVNFSNFKAGGEAAGNVIEVIQEGSMPPSYFTRFGLHKQAKLTKAEIATLIASLKTMPEFKGRARG